jgi:hypothetical protein
LTTGAKQKPVHTGAHHFTVPLRTLMVKHANGWSM